MLPSFEQVSICLQACEVRGAAQCVADGSVMEGGGEFGLV